MKKNGLLRVVRGMEREVIWIVEKKINHLIPDELIDILEDHRQVDGTVILDNDSIEDMLDEGTITERQAEILRKVLKETNPNGITIWIGYNR